MLCGLRFAGLGSHAATSSVVKCSRKLTLHTGGPIGWELLWVRASRHQRSCGNVTSSHQETKEADRGCPIVTESVQVWIDQELCTGDGLCVQYAPEVFEFDIDGLAYVKDDAGELLATPGARVDVPDGL